MMVENANGFCGQFFLTARILDIIVIYVIFKTDSPTDCARGAFWLIGLRPFLSLNRRFG